LVVLKNDGQNKNSCPRKSSTKKTTPYIFIAQEFKPRFVLMDLSFNFFSDRADIPVVFNLDKGEIVLILPDIGKRSWNIFRLKLQ
jgi:hypothetical protein